MNKRGQLTLFVIVAIIIVAALFIFLIYPKIEVYITDADPNSYLRSCLEPSLERSLEPLLIQGGYRNPDNAVAYNDIQIQYLCYTAENYKPCKVQQPLLRQHIEEELETDLQVKASECLDELKAVYERKGYEVSSSGAKVNVSIVPSAVRVEFNSPLALTKDQRQTFESVSIEKPSNLYDLILTATSIIDFESSVGDTDTLLYIQFYPDLSIDKIKRDGDTIYTIKNVISNEEFTFATRSLVWPPGYGVGDSA